MGGAGSGSWYRWSKKTTTESQYRIDIRWMKKNNRLVPGIVNSLAWSCWGEQSGFVNYRAKADRLILIYRTRQNGGDWENIENEILFTWTPCNYGGRRQWFLCPGCHRRVAIIYGGKYFRCRHCQNLTYSSQQENEPDRLMRKVWNIRTRLGAADDLTIPILFKPKNMHQKTFDRLRNEAEHATTLAWTIMGERLGVDIIGTDIDW